MTHKISSRLTNRSLLAVVLVVLIAQLAPIACQLPDDIQRELNQNLAEQARIQAMRQQQQQQQQQQQAQNRAGASRQPGASNSANAQGHDPNNYSYQQISPPIQYSYYQPYGDAAQPASNSNGAAGNSHSQPAAAQGAAPKIDFDLNNLNFDLPQPQAQVSGQRAPMGSNYHQSPSKQQHLVPSFTGVGGLPIMQPAANAASQADNSYAPAGQAPLAPQAQVQRGPPLTEADFKDITGGENYGAPGGSDFGMGDVSAGAGNAHSSPASSSSSDTDAQLREFGLPADPASAPQSHRRSNSNSQMSIPDFGSFNPIGGAQTRQSNPANGLGGMGDFGNFGNMGAPGGGGGDADISRGGADPSAGGGGDFDFASQPSSNQGDQATAAINGGAPGSLQSLLGQGFPGLGGNANSGLDEFARAGNNPQQGSGRVRTDDGATDIADLGEKSDQFSGADLGGFEQPGPQNDQDFNYAAASSQQPSSVPYPDSNPQPVGTLWALTQPQSLTQTRYNALPDKGTYQDYPAYREGGNDFSAVGRVVDSTPPARATGPGRYGNPTPNDMAPEQRQALGVHYNYNRSPGSSQVSRYGL